MAVAQVAQQLHFHILDMEMMAAQMTADTLLTDMTHPGPDFTLQVSPPGPLPGGRAVLVAACAGALPPGLCAGGWACSCESACFQVRAPCVRTAQVLNMLLNMEHAQREARQSGGAQLQRGAGAWVKWQQQLFFRGLGRRLLDMQP